MAFYLSVCRMTQTKEHTDSTIEHSDLIGWDAQAVRAQFRANTYGGHTAGFAAGKLQANLVIMPEAYALDFMRFCQRNPKPCPLVGVSDTGSSVMQTLGQDIDVCTDVPAYNVYREGVLTETVADLNEIWADDFVAFALGCSFTFEHAALKAGVPMWHIENNTTVPMFRCNVDCVPAGRFSGATVVSMRAIAEDQVDLIAQISAKYPLAHGSPLHVGDPAAIGITDINRPDWGDSMPVENGQVPVFWACGVTPQVAIEKARIPIVVTHKPGCMLISDIDENAESPVLTTKL
jgi:uncharacterized protein YcsI (UPF0317 family)